VTKEELRLEAYRRLASVTTQAEVDDIRTEWQDRYGPVPGEAGSPPAGEEAPAPEAAAVVVSRRGS
jgi:TRCF domain